MKNFNNNTLLTEIHSGKVVHRVKASNISNLEIILVDNSNDTPTNIRKRVHTLVDELSIMKKLKGA